MFSRFPSLLLTAVGEEGGGSCVGREVCVNVVLVSGHCICFMSLFSPVCLFAFLRSHFSLLPLSLAVPPISLILSCFPLHPFSLHFNLSIMRVSLSFSHISPSSFSLIFFLFSLPSTLPSLYIYIFPLFHNPSLFICHFLCIYLPISLSIHIT